jgi:molecular chaperone GrpE
MTSSRSRTHASSHGTRDARDEADAAERRGAMDDQDVPDSDAPVDVGPADASRTPDTDPHLDAQALRDRWLRTEAEFQNYRRRSAREVEEARRSAEESVLLEIIGFLDDLERGLDSARSAGADAAWTQGIELVAQRMRDVLGRAGVVILDPLGKPFDPREHEAMLELESPGAAPGTVTAVIRNGYRRGDRILRAARVAVAGENSVAE